MGTSKIDKNLARVSKEYNAVQKELYADGMMNVEKLTPEQIKEEETKAEILDTRSSGKPTKEQERRKQYLSDISSELSGKPTKGMTDVEKDSHNFQKTRVADARKKLKEELAAQAALGGNKSGAEKMTADEIAKINNKKTNSITPTSPDVSKNATNVILDKEGDKMSFTKNPVGQVSRLNNRLRGQIKEGIEGQRQGKLDQKNYEDDPVTGEIYKRVSEAKEQQAQLRDRKNQGFEDTTNGTNIDKAIEDLADHINKISQGGAEREGTTSATRLEKANRAAGKPNEKIEVVAEVDIAFSDEMKEAIGGTVKDAMGGNMVKMIKLLVGAAFDEQNGNPSPPKVTPR